MLVTESGNECDVLDPEKWAAIAAAPPPWDYAEGQRLLKSGLGSKKMNRRRFGLTTWNRGTDGGAQVQISCARRLVVLSTVCACFCDKIAVLCAPPFKEGNYDYFRIA